MKDFSNIVKLLIKNNKTISIMESCTGGGVANTITNIEGSSEVFKFVAITYSNEYKIEMGVSKDIIDKYSVYSMETANEISKNISLFTNSNYGIGITGKLNRIDKYNPYGKDNIVYISIYDSDNDEYYNSIVEATCTNRRENKELIINKIIMMMENILI